MQQHSSIITGPLLVLLLLLSCSSGEEILKEEIPPVLPEEKVTVSFSGKMELAETKAEEGGTPTQTQTLREGVNVTIRAYKQTEAGKPTAAPQLCYDYLVQSDGSLKVKSGEEMLLSAGAYTFYALSVNAAGDTVPPALASGSFSDTETLKNNTDYLYCAVTQTIKSAPDSAAQNVPLTFTRLAARLQISIVSEVGEGGDDKITAAEAPSVKLPLTDPSGSKITLGATAPVGQGTAVTGEAAYTTLQSKGDYTTGYTAGAILLPIAAGQALPVSIVFPSISFNGLAAQINKLYTLTITTPTGGFVSGNQYNYKVNITGNQIGFTTLSVTPWTTKDGSLPNGNITEDFD
ncbi:MAG: fimbrillin family protein [Parabacteroides sp.]|nr:fimbrillin family protein [Parabacteroides sp.]